jgi:alpha-tubulin suppressor-like RCC1 family protein
VRLLFVLAFVIACGRVNFDIAPGSSPIGGTCETDEQCPLCARCENETCVVEPVTDVFLGHRQLCYLGRDGSRWCAGENTGDTGLSLGTTDDAVFRPRRIPGEDGWSTLFLAWGGGNGIRDGRLWDLGSVPVEASDSDISNLKDIQHEAFGSCRVFSDDTLSCDPTMATWLAFDQGVKSQCGVKTDGTLWCWGTNESNALGQGEMPEGMQFDNPAQVGTDTNWREVGIGARVACAIKTDDTLYCWGAPGLTGTNRVDAMGVPLRVGSDADWETLDTHWARTCARKRDGRWFCWGDDQDAPIVPGSWIVVEPAELTGGPYDRVVVGGHAACARRLDGQWACLGTNAYGMLGIGTDEQPDGFAELCAAN